MAEVPPLQRVPAPVLVLGAIVSVQTGAALAKSLFASLGPTGATAIRLVSGAVVLLVLIRPRLPATGRGLLIAYGAALGCMNLSFYLALDRIPLGAAVTVEFLGPLGVAIAGSRRGRDFAAVAVAAGGILLLARGGRCLLGGLHPDLRGRGQAFGRGLSARVVHGDRDDHRVAVRGTRRRLGRPAHPAAGDRRRIAFQRYP